MPFLVHSEIFHSRVDGSGDDSHLNGEEHDESREGKVWHVVVALGHLSARMQVLPGSICYTRVGGISCSVFLLIIALGLASV